MRPDRTWLFGVCLLVLATAARADEELGDPYAAFAAGEYDRALQGFVDLQVEYPDDPRLALHLGSAHYEMKNYDEAEKAFGRAALQGGDPLRERAYYNLGNTAYRQGKLPDAVEWYKRALELDPDDADAKFNLEFVRDEIRRRHEEQQKREQEQQQQQKQCDNPQQQQGQQDQQQQQQGQQEQEQQQGQQEQEQQQGQQEQEQQQGQQEQEQQQGQQEQEQQQGQQAGEEQQEQQAGEGQPMQAREMTPEEAERYLQGLSEDRKKHLEKKRAKAGRKRRPSKDW